MTTHEVCWPCSTFSLLTIGRPLQGYTSQQKMFSAIYSVSILHWCKSDWSKHSAGRSKCILCRGICDKGRAQKSWQKKQPSPFHCQMGLTLAVQILPILRITTIERRGYDNVISTITGDEESEMAKKACEVLQTFDRLMPRDNEIGYLVCYHPINEKLHCEFFFSFFRDLFANQSRSHKPDENHLPEGFPQSPSTTSWAPLSYGWQNIIRKNKREANSNMKHWKAYSCRFSPSVCVLKCFNYLLLIICHAQSW